MTASLRLFCKRNNATLGRLICLVYGRDTLLEAVARPSGRAFQRRRGVEGTGAQGGEKKMKKLLAITLTLASFVVLGFSEQASAATSSVTNATASAAPQWNRNRRNRSYRSRVRTYRTSRIVRYGRRTYRETYLVRALPNGRTQTTLISRVRIA
jgi:hypothetical protein